MLALKLNLIFSPSCVSYFSIVIVLDCCFGRGCFSRCPSISLSSPLRSRRSGYPVGLRWYTSSGSKGNGTF